MKKVYLLLALLGFGFSAFAQTSSYNAIWPNPLGNPGGINTSADNLITLFPTIASPNIANTSVNGWCNPIALPFSFNFFGVPVTQVRIARNGLVTFSVPAGPPPNGDNENLPSTLLPDRTICAFWSDYTGTTQGSTASIRCGTFGTAPNRQFWIRWNQVRYGDPIHTAAFNTACILEESTNNIYILDYKNLNSASRNPNWQSTVGVQWSPGFAVQYGTRTINLEASPSTTNQADNAYYRFTPLPLLSRDAIAVGINNINSDCNLGSSTPITASFASIGTNNIAAGSYQVCYRINNQPPVCFNPGTTLVSFQQPQQITFPTPADFSLPGPYAIRAWVNATGDTRQSNDTTPILNVSSKVRILPGHPIINYESFPAFQTVLDSFFIEANSNAQAAVLAGSGRNNSVGLRMTALGATTGWVQQGNPTNWSENVNFQARARFCLNVAGINNLAVRFDLRQRFGADSVNSNFRIRANGVQVGSTFRPRTSNFDPFTNYEIDLTSAALQAQINNNNRLEVTLESMCQVAPGTTFDAAFVDNIQFFVPPARDMQAVRIDQPLGGICTDPNQQLIVTIRNNGTAAQNNFPIEIRNRWTNALIASTVYSAGPLAPKASAQVTVGTINTLGLDSLPMRLIVLLPNDAFAANDIVERTAILRPRTVLPAFDNDTLVCGPAVVRFPLPSLPSTVLRIYPTPTGGTNILPANTTIFQTPVLNTNTTYYLTGEQNRFYNVGPVSNQIGAGAQVALTGTPQGLRFTVSRNSILESVNVYPNATYSATFSLINDVTGNTIATNSLVVNPVSGNLGFTALLNFPVQPGITYRLVVTTANSGNTLWRNTNGFGFPFQSTPALATIIGSTNTNYNFFYNWVFREELCESVRQPITFNVSLTPVVNLGPDTTICGQVTLNAPTGNGFSYLWQDGNPFSSYTTGSSGTYWVRVTNAEGCVGSDTVRLVRPANPNLLLPGTISGCGEVRLDVTRPDITLYTWSDNPNIRSSVRTFTSSVSNLNIQLQNACSQVATQSVNINVQPGARVFLGKDTLLCKDDILVLDVAQPTFYTYLWSTGSTGTQIVVTQPGTYSVAVSPVPPGGCISRDTITVGYLQDPVSTLPDSASNCGPVFVDAGPEGVNYVWQYQAVQPNGPRATLQGNGRSRTVTQTGKYTVLITNAAGCFIRDSVYVTIVQPFTVDLGPDRAVCTTVVNLDAQNPGKLYQWNTGATTRILPVFADGIYWVRVTDPATNCTVTDSVRILFSPTPVVKLGPDTTVCENYVLDGGNPLSTYQWFRNGVNLGVTTQKYTATQSGTYRVRVTYPCGAAVEDTAIVTFVSPPNPGLLNTYNGCDSLTVSIPPVAGQTAVWSNGQTGNSATFYDSGIRFVDVSLNGCTKRFTFRVNVNPTPNAFILLPDTFFVNQFLQATGDAFPFAFDYSWQMPGATPATANGQQVVFLYADTGTKVITMTARNQNCSTVVTHTIYIDTSFSTARDPRSELQMRLYPNPATDAFVVQAQFYQPVAAIVTLHDLQGRIVKTVNAAENTQLHERISVADLAAGMYTVKLETPYGMTHARLVKR